MNDHPEFPSDHALRHLMESGLLGVVLLDRDCNVVKRIGRLVEWVDEACGAAEAIPFLVGYEDVLAQLCGGAQDTFFLPNVTWWDGSKARARVYSVNAFADQAGAGITLLFQDSTKIAHLEQRVLQQRNLLALAQEELQRQTDRAQAANRAKSAFLANISHELRTPLNVIIGNAEILRDQDTANLTSDEVGTYLADIQDCGTYLLDLINDLLDLSKAEAGKLDLDEEEVPLCDVVDDCLKIAAGLPGAKGLEFQAEVAPPRAVLLADRRRVKQMLLNLLSNAAKFTPDGGCVDVTTATDDGGDLILRVRDTGIGIAPDDLEEIAKPFVQVSGPGSDRHQGTGLGLHLVRTLIELHGGTMEIESAANAGTTVSLRFPAARLA